MTSQTFDLIIRGGTVYDGRLLVAGRVRGVDSDVAGEDVGGFLRHLVPVDVRFTHSDAL